MGDIGSRRGAANLAVPLMIISFVLMGAFMWWLNGEAADSEPIVEAPADTTPRLIATAVTADDLLSGPEQFEGQLVSIDAIGVADVIGDQVFFIDVPQAPFLVKLDTTLVAEGRTSPTGQVSLVGTLHPMNDSVVSDWVETESIAANDQLIVEFATHFIEAVRVDTLAMAEDPGAAGAGGAPGGGG